jgi:hypothetical protein
MHRLPGETPDDTRQSLDLLHALKDARCVIPTLFVPLAETRLQKHESAKLYKLTDLQWEFFFTCWRYNMDFFHRSKRASRLQPGNSNLLLPAGPTPFRKCHEVSPTSPGAFSGVDTQAQALSGFYWKAAAAISCARWCPIPEHAVRPILPVMQDRGECGVTKQC